MQFEQIKLQNRKPQPVCEVVQRSKLVLQVACMLLQVSTILTSISKKIVFENLQERTEMGIEYRKRALSTPTSYTSIEPLPRLARTFSAPTTPLVLPQLKSLVRLDSSILVQPTTLATLASAADFVTTKSIHCNLSTESLKYTTIAETTSTPLYREIITGQQQALQKAHEKTGRWTRKEEEFAKLAIEQYQNGQLILPENVSLRKYIATELNCSTMRVSKKFVMPNVTNRSTSSDEMSEPDALFGSGQRSGRWTKKEEQFAEDAMEQYQRGDLSLTSSLLQYIAKQLNCSTIRVGKKYPMLLTSIEENYPNYKHLSNELRSGRWTNSEEQYANAIGKAFKRGILPFSPSTSLRKLLSKLLHCDPMRVSKKFAGSVKKHGYYEKLACE